MRKQGLTDFTFDHGIRPVLSDYGSALSLSEAWKRLAVATLEVQLAGVPSEPMPALSRKELSDPFTGKPLQWFVGKKCAGLWSVGLDGKK